MRVLQAMTFYSNHPFRPHRNDCGVHQRFRMTPDIVAFERRGHRAASWLLLPREPLASAPCQPRRRSSSPAEPREFAGEELCDRKRSNRREPRKRLLRKTGVSTKSFTSCEPPERHPVAPAAEG